MKGIMVEDSIIKLSRTELAIGVFCSWETRKKEERDVINGSHDRQIHHHRISSGKIESAFDRFVFVVETLVPFF